MREFRSLHLQKNLGEVLTSAKAEPIVLLNRGQPRVVVMSAEEFRRLKSVAGEDIPPAALPRTAKTLRVGNASLADPLGYVVTDHVGLLREMASDGLGPAKRDAILAEAGRARAALRAAGLLPRAKVTA